MIYNIGMSNEALSHLLDMILVEEEISPEPETKECWKDRGATHHISGRDA